MKDIAWRESLFLSKPTVSFHCEFVSRTTASLSRRQDFCTSGTSSAWTPTTCFFGTANTVAKPSHSSLLSCSASAPHLYWDIAEELYPGTLCPLLPIPKERKSYSFVSQVSSGFTKISKQHCPLPAIYPAYTTQVILGWFCIVHFTGLIQSPLFHTM